MTIYSGKLDQGYPGWKQGFELYNEGNKLLLFLIMINYRAEIN